MPRLIERYGIHQRSRGLFSAKEEDDQKTREEQTGIIILYTQHHSMIRMEEKYNGYEDF
jgi:hypothetical protein